MGDRYLLLDEDFSVSRYFVLFTEVDLILRVRSEFFAGSKFAHCSGIHGRFIFTVVKYVVLAEFIIYWIVLEPHGMGSLFFRRPKLFLLNIHATRYSDRAYRSLLWLSTVKYFFNFLYLPVSPVSSGFQLMSKQPT